MTIQTNNNVIITERAEKRVSALLSNEPSGACFRISVEGGGCSGFQYQFAISKEIETDDILIENGKARVVIDKTSLGFLVGSQIDFVDDLIGQSFRISNPNVTNSCGCGTSISV